MNRVTLLPLLIAPTVALLSACGGGDVADEPNQAVEASADERDAEIAAFHRAAPPISPPSSNTAINSARIAAATATAQSSTNPCATVRPFYWEIGDGSGRLASGSVNSSTSTTIYTATTPMSIASSSKWVYGAYVAERRNGTLSTEDLSYLNLKSGYTNFSSCQGSQTVDSCLALGTNGVYDATTAGKFDYGGGHMQKHASLMGLGPMTSKSLASAVMQLIGTDVQVGYGQPQLAGGVYTTPDGYARFLRKIMSGQLHMGALLGSNAVCTNARSCPGQAIFAPIPPTESWHYSVGHWVEDDPAVGDGAFSSAGALGFYPWIDASKTYYGVLARSVSQGAYDSVQCGRLIRKAWSTATAL